MMKTLLLTIAGAALLASPAFAFSKGVPTVQGTANGTPLPIAQTENTTTGSLALTGDTVVLALVGAPSSCIIDVRGTFSGTVNFETSSNGIDFDGMGTYQIPSATSFLSTSAPGQYLGNCAVGVKVQARASAWTSGTATITIRATNATSRVFLNSTGLSNGAGTTVSVKTAQTPPIGNDNALVVTQRPDATCSLSFNFNQTANGQIATSAAGLKIYICGIVLVSATAQSVSIVEGTGTACATGTAGIIGGVTPSVALAANGGFSSVAASPWVVSKTAADNVCLYQSGTGVVSGVISYAAQ